MRAYILFLLLLFSSGEPSDGPAARAEQVLRIVSASWELSTLSMYFAKLEFEEDKARLEENLLLSKRLGRLVACELKQQPLPAHSESAWGVVGRCEFENGAARYYAIFPNRDTQELVGFILLQI